MAEGAVPTPTNRRAPSQLQGAVPEVPKAPAVQERSARPVTVTTDSSSNTRASGFLGVLWWAPRELRL